MNFFRITEQLWKDFSCPKVHEKLSLHEVKTAEHISDQNFVECGSQHYQKNINQSDQFGSSDIYVDW